jgi:hypothetical protein
MFALNTLNRALLVAVIAPLVLSFMNGDAKAEVNSKLHIY